MNFLERFTDEEFELRRKEWMLTGYEVWERRRDVVVGEKHKDWRRFSAGRWKSYHIYSQIYRNSHSLDWHLIETLINVGDDIDGVP